MKFQVPQFIGVEDKIFGPFTFKQFLYLAGGGGLSFVIWSFLKWWGIPLILGMILLAAALAFYKVNGKPFVAVMEAAFKFYAGNRLYTWKKVEEKKAVTTVEEKTQTAPLYVPKLSTSRLKDLTWSLDVKENLNPLTSDEELRHGTSGRRPQFS